MKIGLTPRLRRSPFYAATLRHGVKAFTVYNHMLLPLWYESPEADYLKLITDVTVWDVAAQRQVEIQGPDARDLVQYLTTRNVDKCAIGQARYTLVCNAEGGVLNDPVMLRLADDHFWLSLADNDIGLWAQAVAFERDLDVAVREPDVSPLQVQGPKSHELMTAAFGDMVRDIGYYRFVEADVEGVPLVISRTGWSGEVGYEVWLRDGSKGDWLWERLFAAGEPFGVAPAAPSQIRRIEGGLLSYGTDMDPTVNPHELNLAWLVDLDENDFIGKAALLQIQEEGPKRSLTGVRIEGDPIDSNAEHWDVSRDGHVVGVLTSCVYSPTLGANLGYVLVERAAAAAGTELVVATPDGERTAVTQPLPFVETKK